MHILVEEFPSLADLKPVLPPSDSPAMGKSNVVPMKILFKDEKYKSETTEILTRLVKDAELSGKPEVCLYTLPYLNLCTNLICVALQVYM